VCLYTKSKRGGARHRPSTTAESIALSSSVESPDTPAEPNAFDFQGGKQLFLTGDITNLTFDLETYNTIALSASKELDFTISTD
jgi:hypothetical protein